MRQGYRLTDLISETGVTRWQIHHWVKRGLLPGPGRGRGRLYPAESLARIREIRACYERTMTHRDIYDYLHPEPDEPEPEDAA